GPRPRRRRGSSRRAGTPAAARSPAPASARRSLGHDLSEHAAILAERALKRHRGHWRSRLWTAAGHWTEPSADPFGNYRVVLSLTTSQATVRSPAGELVFCPAWFRVRLRP